MPASELSAATALTPSGTAVDLERARALVAARR